MRNHLSNSSRYVGSVRKERIRQITLAVVTIILLVGLVLVAGVMSRRVVAVLGTPLLRARAVLSETELLSASRDELVAHLRDLQNEHAALRSRLLEATVIEQENARLREFLDVRSLEEGEALLASVLVHPPDTPYGFLVIDRGANDGLMIGDVARIASREVLGEIIAIEPSSAKILLYSAPDERHDVLVGEERLPFTAKGLGGAWRVEVPQESEVALGDVLVDAKSSRLILGYVVSVDEREGEPFKYLYGAPSVNIQELSWVDIVHLE